MTCGQTPSLLSACMWGSCETKPSTIQGLSAWQVWSTPSLSQTHTHRWRFSFRHTTADWFCLYKLQFLPKEADVDPTGVPLIDICSYKQLRNLKKMHLIKQLITNMEQTRVGRISGFGLKWWPKLLVKPLADVLLLLFLNIISVVSSFESSSCDVGNVVISSPALGWSSFFRALFWP